MTFQNDGFCEYYKTPIENTKRVNATKNYHNMKNEMIVFKKLLEKDDRIKIDSTLQKIMEKVDITEELNKPRPKPPTMREKIEMMKTKNKKKIKNMGKKKVKKKKKTKE